MKIIVWHSSPVKFALTLRKIGSFFALDLALQNWPEHSGVEVGIVFYLFPDTANSLSVAHGVTQIINSHTVNMRTLIILSIFLCSCLCLNSCVLRMFYYIIIKHLAYGFYHRTPHPLGRN